MKIGDMIKMKRTGEVGLIVEKIRKCVPDGNPNGDFCIEYKFKVACGDKIVIVPQHGFHAYAEVVRESR